MKYLVLICMTALMCISCSDVGNSSSVQENEMSADSLAGDISQDSLAGNVSLDSIPEFQAVYRLLLVGKTLSKTVSLPSTESLVDSSYSGDYLVRTFKVTAQDVVPNLQDFGVNDNVLWPGQVLDGDAFFDSHSYTPLGLVRSPMQLSLSLEGTTQASSNSAIHTLSGKVDQPNLSNVRETIRSLVSSNASSKLPVEFSYEYESIYSESQLQLGLSSLVGSNVLTKSLGIDWSDSKIKSRIVFTFKQRAFSVDMDSPDSVFSSRNTIGELKKALQGRHSPVYVASVDYGCVFYLVVESELQEENLKAALRLGGSSAKGGTSALDSDTKVHVAQFGGSAALHDQLVKSITRDSGLPTIEALLKNQTIESASAVPIAYQLRYLKDNSVAQIALASEYTKKVYLKVNQSVQLILESFIFLDRDGSGAPEGSSSVNVYAFHDSVETLVGTWNGGVASVSPNQTFSHIFQKFNPDKDYFRVTLSVTEKDAFSNDHAYGMGSFYLADWEGKPRTVDAAGDGAASRISFRMERID